MEPNQENFAPVSMRGRRFEIRVDSEHRAWVELEDRDTKAYVRFDARGKVIAGKQRCALDMDEAGRLIHNELGVSLPELVSCLLSVAYATHQRTVSPQPLPQREEATPFRVSTLPSAVSDVRQPSVYVLGTRVAFWVAGDTSYRAGVWQTGIVQSDRLTTSGMVPVLCDPDIPTAWAGNVKDCLPESLRVLDAQHKQIRQAQKRLCRGAAQCPAWNHRLRQPLAPAIKPTTTSETGMHLSELVDIWNKPKEAQAGGAQEAKHGEVHNRCK